MGGEGRKAVADAFVEFESTREVVGKYLWFAVLFGEVLRNSLWPKPHLEDALEEIDDGKAVHMGAALAMSIASNSTAEAAVAEWISRFPSLVELREEFPFFEVRVCESDPRTIVLQI